MADSDAPEATRTVSTVAPQALFLLNHPFIMEQKSALARRILEITGASIKERMDRAYLLLYGRPPSDEESQIGIDFLARAGSDSDKWQAYCEILLCANEFIYVD
jgi:hypothetical protein